jgi:hypothetical protein
VTEGEGHNTARDRSLQYWLREEQKQDPCLPPLSSGLAEMELGVCTALLC